MSFILLESRNKAGFFLRHQNFEGELNRMEPAFGQDYQFELVRSENPEGGFLFSLRSRNFPSRRLRHKNFRLLLEERPDDREGRKLFDQDSRFILRDGLADSRGDSFESVNFPDHFIRHFDFHLFIGKRDDNDENFAGDATWLRRDPQDPSLG